MRSRSLCLLNVVGTFALCTLFLLACSSSDPVFSGRVRDRESGEPIPHARMEIEEQLVPVGEDGEFKIPLDGCHYRVVVSASGYVGESFIVHLDEGTEQHVRDVYLERRLLHGQVFDASSLVPLPDVLVSSADVTRTTGADGRFELPYLKWQPLSFAKPCYCEGRVPGEAVRDHLSVPGAITETLSVFLQPCTVKGLVREEGSGEPIPEARIRAGDTMTHSNGMGHYSLGCLSLGSTMAFSSPAYHTHTITYNGQREEDVFLKPWQAEITVFDESTGEPLSQVCVSSSRDEAFTDSDGRATLRIPLDEKVQISHDGYRTEELPFTGQPVMEVGLRCSRFMAKLTDAATGKPIEGALVLAYSSEGNLPTALRSDREGIFMVDDVFAVRECLIKAPGYARVSIPITRVGYVSIPLEKHEVHGIYIPFGLLTVPGRLSEILGLVETSDELNGIVVDVKSDMARIAWPSEVPVAQEIGAYQKDVVDLREFVRACKERGIYTIARMVIFKDDLLAQARPEWAVKRESGEFYLDWEDLRWTDPFRQEVRDYNIALALEVVDMGFDEIQFDYLRFPSDGKISDLVYEEESTFDTRTAAMDAFCAQAYEALSKTPAFFSADVFGLTVWVDPARDLGIGQRIDDIAPHVDYISPMVYPTTFIRGNLGYAEPARYPYEVVYHSIVTLRERTTVPVRPWLQHYSLGSVPYDVPEFLVQRKAAEDAGSVGWLFWNAGARYDEAVFEADPYHRLTHIPSPPEEETEEPRE
ncbi:MAG: putative glycoside hydrolase [Chloroflexota bacterium]|nr:putative glycoside hydrolase [Chloroflexota bacterium]